MYPALNIEQWVYPKNRYIHAATAAEQTAWEKQTKQLDARAAQLKKEFESAKPDEKKKRKAKLDADLKALNAQRPPRPGRIAWVSDGSAKAPEVFFQIIS